MLVSMRTTVSNWFSSAEIGGMPLIIGPWYITSRCSSDSKPASVSGSGRPRRRERSARNARRAFLLDLGISDELLLFDARIVRPHGKRYTRLPAPTSRRAIVVFDRPCAGAATVVRLPRAAVGPP